MGLSEVGCDSGTTEFIGTGAFAPRSESSWPLLHLLLCLAGGDGLILLQLVLTANEASVVTVGWGNSMDCGEKVQSWPTGSGACLELLPWGLIPSFSYM